jgi:hypothetical protein
VDVGVTIAPFLACDSCSRRVCGGTNVDPVLAESEVYEGIGRVREEGLNTRGSLLEGGLRERDLLPPR